MAGRIEGITIVIEGNTTPLQQSLQGVNKVLKDTQMQLKDVNKLLKLDPTNTGLLKQKQEALKTSIDKTKEKLDQEKAALEQLKNADQTPEVTAQMQRLERQIADDEQKLKALKAEARDFGSVAKQQFQAVGDAIKEVGEKVQAAGDKMKDIGTGLTTHVTAPLAALGGASIAAFNEVDSGLDTIIAKTGATGAAADDMGQILNNVATKIPTDFETAGNAIGEVATRFDVSGAQLENLSTQFIKFSELNNTDVTTSVDNVQKALAAYGLTVDDASSYLDRLNKTGQDTGVSVDKLATGIVSNATSFQEMGLSIDQATSFMGQLEKSGANSETVLNGMRKALKNATAEGKPLDQALSELQDTILNGTDGMDGLTAAYELFGKSGDQIYSAVKNGTVNFEELGATVESAMGSVTETFEATLDPTDQFKTTMNELKVVGSEVGSTLLSALVPILQQVGEVIQTLKEKWEALSPETQQAIVKAAMIAAAIGPIIVVIGTLVSGIGSIISIVGSLVGAIGFLFSPMGLIVAAIAAVIAIGVLLYKNWDTVCEWANTVKEKVVEAWNNIKQKVTDAVNNLKAKITEVWNNIKATVTSVVNGVQTAVTTAWTNIKNTVTTVINAIKATVTSVWNAIKATVTSVVNGIKATVSSVWTGIKTTVSSAVDGVKNKVTSVFNSVKSTVTSTWNAIKTAITNPIEAAKTAVGNAINAIKAKFNFSWSLPKLKLPHPSISGHFSLNPPSVPRFSISWYKKAYGTPYLFTSPTVVGNRGFGDGGGSGELVYGRDALLHDIAEASQGGIVVNVYGTGNMNVNQLADAVQDRLVQLQKQRQRAYA